MSYFIYINLISSLLDPRLVDSGLILIYVDAYNSMYFQYMTIILT